MNVPPGLNQHPETKLTHIEKELLWFDGEGHGPSVVNLAIVAYWINEPSVGFAPNAEVPSKLLPRHDRVCYGGPMMTSAQARSLAAALVEAADLAEAAKAAQPSLPGINS